MQFRYPDASTDHSCFACEHWEIEYPLPQSAKCLNPDCVRIRVMPERGCSCWVRAIGSDDEH